MGPRPRISSTPSVRVISSRSPAMAGEGVPSFRRRRGNHGEIRQAPARAASCRPKTGSLGTRGGCFLGKFLSGRSLISSRRAGGIRSWVTLPASRRPWRSPRCGWALLARVWSISTKARMICMFVCTATRLRSTPASTVTLCSVQT